MDAAVVYESLSGNTRAVAGAIAAGITDADPVARVMVMPVAEATPGHVATAGLRRLTPASPIRWPAAPPVRSPGRCAVTATGSPLRPKGSS